jgi:hypothetical protein
MRVRVRWSPYYIVQVFLALATILSSSTGAAAGAYDNITILKISASDARAVIKGPDGAVKVIKPGDVLDGQGKVVEIAASASLHPYRPDDC